jgi:tol-pal system protein YbgF
MKKVVLVLVMLSMASPIWAANKDFERLYLQVAALQSEISELRRMSEDTQRELRRLNEALAEQNTLIKKALQDQRQQSESTLDTLKEISEALSSMRDRNVSTLAPARPADSGLPVDPGSATTAPDTPASNSNPPAERELYSQAYADYARGNYDIAIQAFQEFLKYYPSTQLSDNAQYWIGECHFGKQQYADAITAWDELLRQYPGTDKIPDARFKKAVALEKMGRRQLALLEYRYITEHYPNSEAGRKARERIQVR